MVRFSPEGTAWVASFAASRRLAFTPHPDGTWFRKWEPFDTMVAPLYWYNAVTDRSLFGTIVIAEAWTAEEGSYPIERTLVGFAEVPTPLRRASMRVGEPFLTKVAYLDAPRPPEVKLGDRGWDAHVTTFAASAGEALIAFPERFRRFLRERAFRGHLEMRPFGFVAHHEGFGPYDYEKTLLMMNELATTLRKG